MTDDKSRMESAENPADDSGKLSDIIAQKRAGRNLSAAGDAFEDIRRRNRRQFGDMIYTGGTENEEKSAAGSDGTEKKSGSAAGYGDSGKYIKPAARSVNSGKYITPAVRSESSVREGRGHSGGYNSAISGMRSTDPVISGQFRGEESRKRSAGKKNNNRTQGRERQESVRRSRNLRVVHSSTENEERPHRKAASKTTRKRPVQLSREELNRRRRQRIKRIRFVLTAGVLIFLILSAASLRVTDVTVEGSTRYTDEEIEGYIFGEGLSANPIAFLLREAANQNADIPFVDKYTVQMTGLTSADVIVYERNIIAYLQVMGSCIYIDQDGYAVESSNEVKEGVLYITGLASDSIVLGEKISGVDDRTITEIQSISRFMKNTEISWGGSDTPLINILDSVDFDSSDNATCNFGSILVYLGNDDNTEEKLLEMADILPKLRGKSGTLYLNTYNENSNDSSYVFR